MEDAKPKLTLKLSPEQASQLSQLASKKAGASVSKKEEKKADDRLNLFVEREDYKRMLTYLTKKYPKCFCSFQIPSKKDPNVKRTVVKTLAKGIKQQLQEREKGILSKNSITLFLKYYTRDKDYFNSHAPNIKRFDLDGNVVGLVTKGEVKGKKKEKKRIFDGIKERMAKKEKEEKIPKP